MALELRVCKGSGHPVLQAYSARHCRPASILEKGLRKLVTAGGWHAASWQDLEPPAQLFPSGAGRTLGWGGGGTLWGGGGGPEGGRGGGPPPYLSHTQPP